MILYVYDAMQYRHHVSHFHVDERLHIGELEAEEEAHKLDIPLLHCQVKNCLVAFDFLKDKGILVNKVRLKQHQSKCGMNEISSFCGSLKTKPLYMEQ